jgi:hypothetical protein
MGGEAAGMPSDEELQAALDEQMRRLTVPDVLAQTVVTLINLGARKLGLTGGPEGAEAGERDLEQARLAIEATRALLPLVPAEPSQIREALSQLQMAYAREAGGQARLRPPRDRAPRGPNLRRARPPPGPPMTRIERGRARRSGLPGAAENDAARSAQGEAGQVRLRPPSPLDCPRFRIRHPPARCSRRPSPPSARRGSGHRPTAPPRRPSASRAPAGRKTFSRATNQRTSPEES